MTATPHSDLGLRIADRPGNPDMYAVADPPGDGAPYVVAWAHLVKPGLWHIRAAGSERVVHRCWARRAARTKLARLARARIGAAGGES